MFVLTALLALVSAGTHRVAARLPTPPPADVTVLLALPPLPAGVTRDDVCIVKNRITPKQWRCSVYFTERVDAPGEPVSGRKRVQTVQITP